MTLIIGLICLALLALLAWREKRHEEILRELMQRIQAPDLAVAQAARRSRRPSPLPFDDTDERAKVIRLRKEGVSDDGDADGDS